MGMEKVEHYWYLYNVQRNAREFPFRRDRPTGA